jgi:hypothetical protein
MPKGGSRPVAKARISATYCSTSSPMPIGIEASGIHIRARHTVSERQLLEKAWYQ